MSGEYGPRSAINAFTWADDLSAPAGACIRIRHWGRAHFPAPTSADAIPQSAPLSWTRDGRVAIGAGGRFPCQGVAVNITAAYSSATRDAISEAGPPLFSRTGQPPKRNASAWYRLTRSGSAVSRARVA